MKKIPLFIIYLFFCLNISAQNTLGVIYYQKLKVTAFHEEISNARKKVYTSTDWIQGSMILLDSTLVSPAANKYDVKNDRMEITLIEDPSSVSKIMMGAKFFIYSNYYNETGKISSGYFEILSDGEAKILNRKFTKNVHGKQGAYGNESYSAIDEQDFLKVGQNPAISLKSPDDLILKQFDNQKSLIQDFIQRNKLNINRKKHLFEIIEFYNS